MDDSPRVPVIVSCDISCPGCGYNLRGLRPDGRCPECGHTLPPPLPGEAMPLADPRWVGTLATGVRIRSWSILIWWVSALLLLAAATTNATASVLLGPAMRYAAAAGAVIGAMLGVWGTFRITTPEPHLSSRRPQTMARRTIRACTVICLVGWVGALLARDGASRVVCLVYLAADLMRLGGTLQFAGELSVLRTFAQRVPNQLLEERTPPLLFVLPTAYALLIISGMLHTVIAGPSAITIWPSPAPTAVEYIINGTTIVAGICILLALPAYALLLERYRRALARVTKEASDLAQPAAKQNCATAP